MAATTVPAFDTGYDVAEADLCNLALARIGEEAILDSAENNEVARICRRFFGPIRDEMQREYEFRFCLKHDFIPEVEYLDKDIYGHAYQIPASLLALRVLEVGSIAKVDAQERIGGYILSDEVTREELSFTADTTSGSAALAGCPEDLDLDALSYLEGAGIPAFTRFLSQAGAVVTMSAPATATASAVEVTAPRLLRIRYLKRIVDPAEWDPLFKDAFVLRLASKIAFSSTSHFDLVQALEAEYAAVIEKAFAASSSEREYDEGETLWTEARG